VTGSPKPGAGVDEDRHIRLGHRAGLAGYGAGDAGAGGGAGREPFGGDRPAAPLAPSVAALPEPAEGGVQLGEVGPGLVEQGGQMGPLERDSGAFGIVLVVGGDPRGRLDDPVELAAHRGDPVQGLLPLGGQRVADRRRRAGRQAAGPVASLVAGHP
jgi:hypothetical protein